MAQEFTINSSAIESKINQLLPSQGGFGAGIDFSASTMVIPIVDLTETAEGSDVREDLQTALSLSSVTSFSVSNTTSTLVNTTGYFRVFGAYSSNNNNAGTHTGSFTLTDGISSKIILSYNNVNNANENSINSNFDFIVFIKAGDSLTATTNTANSFLIGSTRQIADISGNLVNP